MRRAMHASLRAWRQDTHGERTEGRDHTLIGLDPLCMCSRW